MDYLGVATWLTITLFLWEKYPHSIQVGLSVLNHICSSWPSALTTNYICGGYLTQTRPIHLSLGTQNWDKKMAKTFQQGNEDCDLLKWKLWTHIPSHRQEQSSQSTEKEDKADMQREAEMRDRRRCQVPEHFLIPSLVPSRDLPTFLPWIPGVCIFIAA